MEKTYDWSAYYQEALKRQKKENRKLASELSDMQAKQEMLAAKYTKFTSGAFGKVLHASTLPKRAIKKLLGRSAGGARVTGETVEATHPLYLAYEEKLASQKYAYREWIREIEVALPQIGKAPEGAVEVLSFAEFASNLLAGDLWENEAKVLMVAEDPAALSDDACGAAWAYFAAHPSARLWYAQEDQIDLSGERTLPWFKPRWSPETLISFFYFGSFAAFRSETLGKCRELLTEVCAQCCNDLEQDARSVVYAASLALAFADMDAFAVDTTGQGMCEEVCGLTDRILYHRAATGSGQEDACQPENAADPLKVNAAPQSPEPVVLETTNSMDYASCPQYFGYEARFVPIKQAVLRRLGIQTRALFTSAPDVVSIVPVHDAALVSIIIPSKDHPELVEQCLTQLLEKTTYPALELILVDNGSGNEHRKQIETITASLSARYHVRIHYQVEPMPFNFSKMCNLGADVANGKYLLLLNDDTTVCEQDWLEIMVGEAQYPGVGAVGAKLWYPTEERIQHAGITNLAIGPSHKLVTFPDDRTYYFGHNTMNYVMSAVTAACLLVRADLYRQVGGMDETMAVAYNDVDLNFKLLEHGYRSVQR
ncbi:MAG: glycosyltransferase, partial [Lachnospiraceae bacterium]|nr:glycosyltransferase [Lachnospiraceae bacterium]